MWRGQSDAVSMLGGACGGSDAVSMLSAHDDAVSMLCVKCHAVQC